MHNLKNSFLYTLGYLSKNSIFKQNISSLIDGYSLKLNRLPCLERRQKIPFQILVYHRVLPQNDPFAIGVVTVDDFKKQIKILASYFRIVSIEDVINEVEIGKLQSNTICITFDDGYYDNYEYAFPILRDFNIPATIFLTTDFIGSHEMLWHDKVLHMFKHTKIEWFYLEDFQQKDYSLSNVEERRKTVNMLLEWLKKLSPVERNNYIPRLMEICKLSEFKNSRLMLNWDEVSQMHLNGISFGAHTKTHPILSSLSEKQIKQEIIESKEAIENHLSKQIYAFAYPNGKPGDFDDRCKRLVKEAGFKCAVTTYGSVNNSAGDLFELSRLLPWDFNSNRFLGRILMERFKG